jgi:hypothetical protein
MSIGGQKNVKTKKYIHNRKTSGVELLKDKEQAYYYTEVLLPSGRVLGEFINGGN